MVLTSPLPYYDLGPGNEQNELIVNIVIYVMVAAFFSSLLWLAGSFVTDARAQRTQSLRSPDTGDEGLGTTEPRP